MHTIRRRMPQHHKSQPVLVCALFKYRHVHRTYKNFECIVYSNVQDWGTAPVFSVMDLRWGLVSTVCKAAATE